MDAKTTKPHGRTFTKANAKTLAEFMSIADKDGCMKASDWIPGHGGYTSRRATPPFVHEFRRDNAVMNARRGTLEHVAAGFLRANPQVRKVLVLDQASYFAFLAEAASGTELPDNALRRTGRTENHDGQ